MKEYRDILIGRDPSDECDRFKAEDEAQRRILPAFPRQGVIVDVSVSTEAHLVSIRQELGEVLAVDPGRIRRQ